MTPETAQALEPGTTPGPWEAYDPGDGTARLYAGEVEEARPLLHNVDSDPHTACVYVTREDGNLIAAAPDMRATIAAQTWEWGVEDVYGDTAWMVCDHYEGTQDSETEAREYLSTFGPDSIARLVRRLVGSVEVVEE